MIGLLLVTIAVILVVEMKSLLIGESASAEHQEAIRAAIAATPDVRGLIHMRTLHLGPDELLVAAKIDLGAGPGRDPDRRGDRRGRGAGALGRADRPGHLPGAGPPEPGPGPGPGGHRDALLGPGGLDLGLGAWTSWPTSLRSRKIRVAMRPIRAMPAPTANAYWKPSVRAPGSAEAFPPASLISESVWVVATVGQDRDAERAADLLGRVDEARGDPRLVGLHALQGRDRDRHEGEAQADAGEEEARHQVGDVACR